MKKSLAILLMMALLFSLVPAGAETAASNEAPLLTARVAAGELPTLNERLPAEPKVFDTITDEYLNVEIGTYGGTLRTISGSTPTRMLVEPLLTYPNMEDTEVTGNVFKGYDLSENEKVYTFYMREGMKWSDGTPLTTADVAFTFNDLYLNTEYTPVFPAWLCSAGNANGTPATLEIVDDYTFKLIFDEPYPGLPMRLAIKNWVSYYDLVNPAHYLKQYHPAYADADALQAKITEMGYDNWISLFDYYRINANGEEVNESSIGSPVLNAWLVTEVTDTYYIMERNPYYFVVDAAGNQLPYIDYIRCENVDDAQVRQMKLISGEIDYDGFDGSLNNMAMYMENAEAKGYKVVMSNWHTSNNDFYFSMAHDPSAKITELISNVEFRQAINYAIDKQDIIDTVYLGFAAPSTITPDVYDVNKANELLDKLLPMGPEGWRTYPDGSEFSLQCLVTEMAAVMVPTAEMIASMLGDVGIKCEVKPIELGLGAMMALSGEHESLIMWTELLWFNVGEWMISMYGNPWYTWWTTAGTAGIEPPENMKELFAMHDDMHTGSVENAVSTFEEIKKIYGEELYIIRIADSVQQPLIANENLGNLDYKKLPWGINVTFGGKILFYKNAD